MTATEPVKLVPRVSLSEIQRWMFQGNGEAGQDK